MLPLAGWPGEMSGNTAPEEGRHQPPKELISPPHRAGLKAMRELQEINPERHRQQPSMIMFLVLNTRASR